MSALFGAKASWYLMRGSGFVALGLLTLTLGLGIANVARWQRGRWTRAIVALVHRNASLLAVAFLAIHVTTAISDKYVSISPLATIIPGLSGYDPLWIGLAAVAVDVTLAVIVTSLLRGRLGRRTWRAVHWLAYLAWPTALVHAIGAGSGRGVDSGHLWSTLIYVAAGTSVAIAVAARVRARRRPAGPRTVRTQRPVARPRTQPVPALAASGGPRTLSASGPVWRPLRSDRASAGGLYDPRPLTLSATRAHHADPAAPSRRRPSTRSAARYMA